MVTERVQKFLPIVASELERGGFPVPPALILSVIAAESGGDVGQVNTKSGASGLMQVMPIALRDYNQRNRTDLKMSDMRATDDRGALLQIRVGTYMLSHFWRRAFSYLKARIGSPPLDELAQVAQLFYVAGPGGARNWLDAVEPPTFAAVAARWPKKSAVHYVRKVWRLTGEQSPVWDMDAIDRWLGGDVEPDKPPLIARTPRNGFLLAMLVVAVASAYLKKK